MRILNLFAVAGAVSALALSSCSDNDDVKDPTLPSGAVSEINFANNDDRDITYNSDGYWDDCYDATQADALTYYNVNFSHSASVTPEYSSWTGFCPSISSDVRDWGNNNWEHQWTAMPGRGVNGVGTNSPYMIGFWNSSEATDRIPENPSLCIKPVIRVRFIPQYIWVTNTTYAYYTMKNGSAYSQPFDATSWFKVTAYGVKGGSATGSVDFYLWKDGAGVTGWERVDISALGAVDYIYFQMSSSDTGEWGMNNPAYFALGHMSLVPLS